MIAMAGGFAERLNREWRTDIEPWGAPVSEMDAVFDELANRYLEPHRHYHDLAHVASVRRFAESAISEAADPAAVRLAVWYHDVVYDPRATDNEARSAELAITHLDRLGVPRRVSLESARLIELTAHHRTGAHDANGSVVLDADLAILASSPDRYDRYVAGVRAEYSHVNDAAFDRGRYDVVQGFLGRRAIYRTPTFRTDREARARANLQRELDNLVGG
jgi:predicted metal-dependent HD superfamily phosphohydrolase